MKLKYTYQFNNEQITIEVDEAFYHVLVELDRREYNIDHKETRRHTSLDSYEGIDNPSCENPRLSRDAFEFRNGICNDGTELFSDLEMEYERAHIRSAVNKLGPSQRELITAIYFQGISVNNYAKRAGVDHSAISHRLKTAYKNLKKYL
jgi:RNA polymerase sigma factor (sigma-70 family)